MPGRMITVKKKKLTSVGDSVEKGETLHIFGRNVC